ncbi:MAG: glutamate formimidoyltransferase [Candidatus Heimdallarchaeota archaeon]|nr:glutamate formimidoyltransferase [Candidatus Heimdallarchaeota archaeon]MBY8993404.1 glutamate formimidoyltransferase [Candidatus Heimdallarchaeota archaeon]
MSKKRKIVESVPNYSEGTDGKVVEAIVDEIRNTPKTRIVDIQYDSDYNRAVITFVGEPEAVLQANIAASKKALELIDMTKHKGQHPRIGATDVVPFVPAQNMTMEECTDLAKRYAEAMAKEGIPIYLYEESATKPERKNIDNIRVGDYEGLRKTIETNPDHKPDFGPSKFHPKGGATVTGARMPLVCLNINLGTSDVKIAKRVARRIHLASGGLVNIKAMGTEIDGEDFVQVGISNVNYKKTPMYRQLELARIEAARYGVPIIGTELVGPIPLESALNSLEYYLQLVNPKKLTEENLIEHYFDF